MRFTDRFRRVHTVNPEEARTWIDTRPPDTYTLLDVRQPAEYEGGHLPGAVPIPLGDLPDRLGELDPKKPLLAY